MFQLKSVPVLYDVFVSNVYPDLSIDSKCKFLSCDIIAFCERGLHSSADDNLRHVNGFLNTSNCKQILTAVCNAVYCTRKHTLFFTTKRYISEKICTVFTRTSYIIVLLTNMNIYNDDTSESEGKIKVQCVYVQIEKQKNFDKKGTLRLHILCANVLASS